jgi:hypothetical protein
METANINQVSEKTEKDYFPLRIDLLRFPIQKEKIKDIVSHYVMWGYYDRAVISTAKCSLHDLFIAKNDFDYSKKFPYEHQFLAGYSVESLEGFTNDNAPAIVISEIKLTENCMVRNGENSLHSIKEEIDNELYKFKDFNHYSLLSLGYNDLLILFTCTSYLPVIEAIDNIKNVNSVTSKYVRSTYSLHGVNHDSLKTWRDPNIDKLSIFVSLKPGASGNKVAKQIENELKGISPKLSIQDYSLLGKYDVELLISDKPKESEIKGAEKRENEICAFDNIGNIFLKKAILSVESDSFKKNINFTRTRWLYSGEMLSTSLVDGNQKTNVEKTEIKDQTKNITNQVPFKTDPWKIFNQLDEYLVEKNLGWSFKSLIDYFWQTTTNEIINPILLDEFNEVLCDLVDTVIKSDQYDKKSFDHLVFHLAELLQDWVQSARTIFEGPSYNIQFINSSSKVYISYYEVVNSIEFVLNKQIMNANLGKQEQHAVPNYFVMIHHDENISSELMFSKNLKGKDAIIIPILIDRETFFTPHKCFPLIFHEMGHYISYNFKKRNEAFLRTVCLNLSRELVKDITGAGSNYFANNLLKMCSSKSSGSIDLRVIAISKIFDLLIGEIFKNISSDEASEIILDNFANIIFSKIQSIFSPINSKIDETMEKLRYQLVGTGVEDQLDFLFSQIKDGDDISKFVPVIKRYVGKSKVEDILLVDELLDSLINQYNEQYNYVDRLIQSIVGIILSVFDEEFSITSGFVESMDDTERQYIVNYIAKRKFHEIEKNNELFLKTKILRELRTKKIDETISNYKDLFYETTADLLMIKTMNYDLKNYILLFDNLKNLDQTSEIARKMRNFIYENFWHEIFTTPNLSQDKKNNHEYSNLVLDYLVEYLAEFNQQLDEKYVGNEIIRDVIDYCGLNSSFQDLQIIEHFFNTALLRGDQFGKQHK